MTQWPGVGNVTPHPGQIYQPSMGPVVAGDLISLGLCVVGRRRKQLGPAGPLRGLGPRWATPAGPGLGLPFSPRGKSRQVIVYLVRERMAFLLLFSRPPPLSGFKPRLCHPLTSSS